MTDNPTPNFGGQPSVGPPYGQWTPTQAARRPSGWLAIALAAIATVVAVAALVVALTRPSGSSSSTSVGNSTTSAGDSSAAQQQLCDTYKLAAKAVQVDTNGSDKAFARIALTNSAVMLGNAAASAGIDAEHRAAATALATAYLTDAAKSSDGVATDAEFRAAVDDVNAKDAVMKRLCGGG
jgi:hypothetical protein